MEKIKLSEEHELATFKQTNVLLVSFHDWERLKKYVNRCTCFISWWTNLGSAFLGGTISSLVTFCSLDDSPANNTIRSSIGWITILFFVITLMSYIFAYLSNKVHSVQIEDVKDTIKDIEERLNI